MLHDAARESIACVSLKISFKMFKDKVHSGVQQCLSCLYFQLKAQLMRYKLLKSGYFKIVSHKIKPKPVHDVILEL